MKNCNGSTWFIQFLTRNNFSIKTPAKLEEIRDKYCHSNVLLQFYNNLIAHLPRNPNVIFNADETASSFNGKGKVIVPDGKHPIKYSHIIKSHFTAFCCFNASGTKVLRPFIILPNLKKFPGDLEFLKSHAYFCSSSSGWITSRLFLAFAIYFCHEISLYRIQNKISEDIWLILDGHKSRLNSIAIEYFAQFRINVLILPAHTTHVVQPFDVGLAAPMKQRIRQYIDAPPAFIQDIINSQTTDAAKNRILIVSAIINAWSQVATPLNCASAFYATGIFPFNINKVIQNRFVRTSNANDTVPVERGVAINGQILTTEVKRLEIASNFYNYAFQSIEQIPKYTVASITEWLKSGTEVILQDFPEIYHETAPGVIIHY